MSILDAFYSLGSSLNKQPGKSTDDTKQGVVSEKLPELELDMKNEDLAKLTMKWEKKWDTSEVKTKFDKHGEENEKYWLGEHYQRPQMDKSRANVDNALFESLETYLPQMTRRNPEPMGGNHFEKVLNQPADPNFL